MTTRPNSDEAIQRQLEDIEDRIRNGLLPEASPHPDVLAVSDVLQLIQRVKQNEIQSTLAAGLTLPTTAKMNCLDAERTRIGRFEIRRQIGQGGFGIVFLADDPNLGRQVAVKAPRIEAIATPELRDRFLKEGRAMASLAHPAIVPVFEASSADGICYIASQYIPGESLAAHLQKSRCSVDDSVKIVLRLSEAMEHAHQRGVLHRDIKPTNILVDRDDTLSLSERTMLTDFGLAKDMNEDGSQTKAGDLIGTPSYMSPEQIQGVINAGPASDVYSLGAVLYELLVGQPSFVGESLIETLDQVRQDPVKPPSKLTKNLSRDLDAICLKCLEKRPELRYRSCFELSSDLSRFLRREPVAARRIGRSTKLLRWYARNKMLGTALAVTFLSLILGLAGTLWMYQESQNNLSLATEQSQLAGRGLDRTQRSIDKMLLDVSHALKDKPHMDGLRNRLLNEARQLYQEVIHDNYELEIPNHMALETQYRAAHLEWQLGGYDQAMKRIDEGLDLYNGLGDKEQLQAGNLVVWSQLLQLEQDIHRETGIGDEPRMQLVIDTLKNVGSSDPRVSNSLAEAYKRAGIDHLERGETSLAIEDFNTAMDVLTTAMLQFGSEHHEFERLTF